MAKAIIIGGEAVYCAAQVRAWSETGLAFAGLPKRGDTRAICVHWTGGSGDPRQVFRTLQTRQNAAGKPLRLSVHFCVDVDGTIYQFADVDRRCAHAGSVDDSDHDGHVLSGNEFTIGIEVVDPANGLEMSRGVRRELLRETIHGREIVYSAFTPAQVRAVLDLTKVLCQEYHLPLAVPMADGDVVSTVLDEPTFAAFRGVLGHLHLTTRKQDPGLMILRAIAALKIRSDFPPPPDAIAE